MKKSPRVLLSANIYSAGNIGDDAILEASLACLRLCFPEADITVGTYHGQTLDFLRPGIRYVSSLDAAGVRRAVKSCDWFIGGGGTLIGDELGCELPPALMRAWLAWQKRMERKPQCLPSGLQGSQQTGMAIGQGHCPVFVE